MNFPFYEFGLFLKVIHYKSISLAAKELGMTQSALSYAIKRLEDYFSIPLLLRSKKGVLETKQAKDLKHMLEASYLTLDSARERVKDANDKLRGTFSIGMHPSIALYTLKHFLPKLTADNPQIEFQIRSGQSSEITQKVIDGDIQIGIVTSPENHPDLIIKKIVQETSSLLVHKNFNSKHFKDAPLIHVPAQIQTKNIKKTLSEQNIHYSREISVQNFEIVKELVNQKVGVGIIPFLTLTQKERTHLKLYDSKGPFFNESLCLIARYDYLKADNLKILWDLIFQSLDGKLRSFI